MRPRLPKWRRDGVQEISSGAPCCLLRRAMSSRAHDVQGAEGNFPASKCSLPERSTKSHFPREIETIFRASGSGCIYQVSIKSAPKVLSGFEIPRLHRSPRRGLVRLQSNQRAHYLSARRSSCERAGAARSALRCFLCLQEVSPQAARRLRHRGAGAASENLSLRYWGGG